MGGRDPRDLGGRNGQGQVHPGTDDPAHRVLRLKFGRVVRVYHSGIIRNLTDQTRKNEGKSSAGNQLAQHHGACGAGGRGHVGWIACHRFVGKDGECRSFLRF